MKKLLVLSLLFFVSRSVPAQNYNHVRRMEFEVGMGVSKAHKIDGAAAKAGMQLYLETRMNVVDTPFDVGLQIMLGAFDRKPNYAEYEQTIRYRGIMSFGADYNLRRWKHVAPFVGIGLGMAFVDNTYSPYKSASRREEITDYDRSVVFNPRIGVELFSHLRITAEYKWMKKDYSFFGFNVGFVFGGGRK